MRGLNYKTRFIDLAGELNTEMPVFWVRKVGDALNELGKRSGVFGADRGGRVQEGHRRPGRVPRWTSSGCWSSRVPRWAITIPTFLPSRRMATIASLPLTKETVAGGLRDDRDRSLVADYDLIRQRARDGGHLERVARSLPR